MEWQFWPHRLSGLPFLRLELASMVPLEWLCLVPEHQGLLVILWLILRPVVPMSIQPRISASWAISMDLGQGRQLWRGGSKDLGAVGRTYWLLVTHASRAG